MSFFLSITLWRIIQQFKKVSPRERERESFLTERSTRRHAEREIPFASRVFDQVVDKGVALAWKVRNAIRELAPGIFTCSRHWWVGGGSYKCLPARTQWLRLPCLGKQQSPSLLFRFNSVWWTLQTRPERAGYSEEYAEAARNRPADDISNCLGLTWCFTPLVREICGQESRSSLGRDVDHIIENYSRGISGCLFSRFPVGVFRCKKRKLSFITLLQLMSLSWRFVFLKNSVVRCFGYFQTSSSNVNLYFWVTFLVELSILFRKIRGYLKMNMKR